MSWNFMTAGEKLNIACVAGDVHIWDGENDISEVSRFPKVRIDYGSNWDDDFVIGRLLGYASDYTDDQRKLFYFSGNGDNKYVLKAVSSDLIRKVEAIE